MLLRVSKIYSRDGQPWIEARAPEEIIIHFRAPANKSIEIGDVVSYDWGFVGGEAQVQVYGYKGHAGVTVRKEDAKDLRDRTVAFELTYQQSTRVRLIVTGEVEIAGVCPGGGTRTGFDTVESLDYYLSSVGNTWLEERFDRECPRELRASILEWCRAEVLPKLRKAEKELP